MPKGKKRTSADYEREIEEAAKRIKKYPEHLRSARTSKLWNDFLIDIGVKPEIVKSESGSGFWDKVRQEVLPRESVRLPERQIQEHGAEVLTKLYRDAKGQFTKIATDREVYVYRSIETKRIVSRKSLED